MLLYAIYTPAKVDSFHPVRFFVFASIESFVQASGDYNYGGAELTPVTRDFLNGQGVSLATLIHWNPETKYCEEAGTVFTSDNSMVDNWYGERHEIRLVERAVDEEIIKQVSYA